MHRRCLFAALAALSFFAACLPAPADPPKDKLAVFTQKDPGFAETITLFADGRYEQTETESAKPLYRAGTRHAPAAPDTGIVLPRKFTWRLLDKGGAPLAWKPGNPFPAAAVVELKDAMPFGFVWENQSPFGMHGTRRLDAALFTLAKPAAAPRQINASYPSRFGRGGEPKRAGVGSYPVPSPAAVSRPRSAAKRRSPTQNSAAARISAAALFSASRPARLDHPLTASSSRS